VSRKAPQPLDIDRADSKSARTRARLLDAAAAVLSRKGFAGTRLSDIAEEARIQAPAIYYYYSSREDLIEEVMFAGAAGMRDHMRRALESLPNTAPPTHRLALAVETHLRHELEVSDYAKAIIRNGSQLPEGAAERVCAEISEYNDIWRGLIHEMCDAGQLREDLDPAVARMIVLGALNWAAEWFDPARGSIEDLISTAQSMVLHALRP